jgi:hypothetical protein
MAVRNVVSAMGLTERRPIPPEPPSASRRRSPPLTGELRQAYTRSLARRVDGTEAVEAAVRVIGNVARRWPEVRVIEADLRGPRGAWTVAETSTGAEAAVGDETYVNDGDRRLWCPVVWRWTANALRCAHART